MKNRFNIAVIAGDGIGKEVMPEGIKVLKKVSEKFDINLNFEEFDFSSYDYYEKHGQMMPDNWKEKISNHDAIFLELLVGQKKSQIIFLYGDHF